MNIALKTTVAVIALMVASSASATIIDAKSSDSQGTLVHADGGAADVGSQVTGNLGGGPDSPHIVQFTGSTDATVNTTDANDLRLQQGAGQAELTGAVISGQNFYDLQSGDIFLKDVGTGEEFGMSWIELAFQDLTDTDANNPFTVEFTLSALDGSGNPELDSFFSYILDPNGENKFAFEALDGELITNLSYQLFGGDAGGIRQVRIASLQAGVPAVPEPSTWALMFLGFGAAGFAMRRTRRQGTLAQLA
jgi:hypothetical protein